MNQNELPKSPTKVIAIAFFVNCVVLLLIVWSSYYSCKQAKLATQHSLKLKQLQGSIIHLDEVLTMSARMAATTGDAEWKKRYSENESLLNHVLKEAIKLAPIVESDQSAEKTDSANQVLVDIEQKAFRLVHEGRLEEAQALFESRKYREQKKIYSDGMNNLTAHLNASAGHVFDQQQMVNYLHLGIILFFLIPILIVSWIYMLRSIRTWRNVLDQKVVDLESEIQERMKVEEALDQARLKSDSANQAKSDFLANMSHEIRTPMTAILGFLEILKSEEPSSMSQGQREETIETIERNGQHLLSLINDILDLSKVEAGRLDLELVRCSPFNVVENVVSLLEKKAKDKGLELNTRFDGKIPETIQSDPDRLHQILVNLTGNAIKFTENGSVEIVTRFINNDKMNPRIQFSVIDSGIGIDQKPIDKIFDPFTQADSSTTRKFGGTGLGLAICRRISDLLGGTITAQSIPDEGSIFSLTIPTGELDGVNIVSSKPESDEVPEDESEVTEIIQLPVNCRILVVEDNPDLQNLLLFMLKKEGAEVVCAENGEEAIDLAMKSENEDTPFDIVIMDMQMPVLDGYSTTRKLREYGYQKPIIALTAHAISYDREKCIEAGCDDYITKPVDRKKLFWFINRYVSMAVETSIA